MATATAPAAAADLGYTLRLDPSSITVENGTSGTAVGVRAAGFTTTTDPGLPLLPFRVVNLLLPQGSTVADFDCSASAPVTVADNARPVLVPDAISTDGTRGNGPAMAAWNADEYPSERAVFLGVGHLQGYTIASFAMYPIRFQGNGVVASETLTLHVRTGPADPSFRVATRQRYRDGFHDDVRRELERLVVNPADMASYSMGDTHVPAPKGGFRPTSFPSLEGSPVDYVIITNDSLAAAFQVLADWKTQKGVPTVVRTTEWIEANFRNGVDLAETIRNFIIDAYEDWGIRFVLLGGDTDQIPVRLGATNYFGSKIIPVDMYYGCLDGDWNADHDQLFGEPGTIDQTDLYPEVYTGRLPATSVATTNVLVNKVIHYETPVDRSYTGKVLMLAEVLFPIDWSPGMSITQDGAGITEFVRALALTDPSLTVNRLYENTTPYPGSIPESGVAAIDSINAGYDHIVHVGHGFRFNMSTGTGDIENADADALTNGDRLSNIYMLNCTGLAYTYFCIGEHYLVNPNGGAVSVIGANESAYPLLSQPYMNEYYDLVFNQGVTSIGEAFARSRLPRTPIAQQGDNGDLWTHYIYSMLADPEMPLWTAPVQDLIVTYPSSVGLGTTPVTVTVADGNGPVENARVCLSKGDDDYEVGYTDAAGSVTMSVTAKSAGAVTVVAGAPNRTLHIGTIPATASSSAYLTLAGTAVMDDSTATTSGNGDGVIDVGEVIELTPSIKNTGMTTAQNVTLSLRTSYSGVVIEDSVATVGSVAAGQTVQAADPFRIHLDGSLPDEFPLKFTLSLRENGIPTWSDSFTRIVHAPVLDFAVIRIDDSATGNGDGVVDAGEDFRLFYTVKNFGTGAAFGLTATLADLDNAFVFMDSVDTYPELPAATGAENVAGFPIRESSVATEHHLQLTVTDVNGRSWVKVFELRPPVPPTTMTFDPSLGPDRLQLVWDASASTDAKYYRVYQSTTPGGPYVVATPDPVAHTLFLDRGLQSTTRYYMRVTTVDASGNESAYSPEFSGSTNPRQLEGWPIAMSAETVSSPVVGDIDGDNKFEIVQGDAKIYAWHANGVEVRDADNNAQTWGLFSTLGSSFVSPIALADMDAVPGMEIIAASRDTKEIFVMNYLGNPLPGWPQTVLNPIRAGMVAGDIDGDGQREVIAIDEKGVFYVWHNDGTEYRDGDHNPATNGVFRTFGGCTYQYGTPAVADLDGDGFNEMIVGTQGDSVFALERDGSSFPGWPQKFAAGIASSIAVGDLDGDGNLDLVVPLAGGNIYGVRSTGSILWVRYIANQYSFIPSPALADFNGDGKLETIMPSSNRNLYAVQWNGSDLPGWPVVYATQLYTESSPVVADLDNDGSLDVLLGDETKYLKAWDATGHLMAGFPLALTDAVRATPLIADVDKDGDADVVAAGWDKNVYVWDFPKMFNPLKAPWAKFHANLYNDGNITTPLPTPVRGATFRYTAGGRGVELVWGVPPEAGRVFTVTRAEVVNGAPGSFVRVASGVSLGTDGLLRVTDGKVEMGSRYVYRLEGESGLVDETLAVVVPVSMAKLGQNYPNPFNPTTTIEYWVPGGSGKTAVSVVIYDVRGARVRTLVEGTEPAGRYTATWDGRNEAGTAVSSGVYFYRLQTPGFSDTRKMVLLK